MESKATLYNVMLLPTPHSHIARLVDKKTIDITKDDGTVIIKRKDYNGQLHLRLDDDKTVYQVEKTLSVNPQYIQLELSECKNQDVIEAIGGGGGDDGGTD